MRSLAVASAILFFGTFHNGTVAQTWLGEPAAQTVTSLRDDRSAPRPQASTSWFRRLSSAVGTGLVGAGVGYFASQVVTGDWDANEVDRQTWAAVGGSIGFAVGFSFPLGGRGKANPPARVAPPRRFVITAEEMHGTGVNTAYDAIRLLRPQWLRDPGVHVIGEQQCPGRWSGVPSCPDERVVVYLDESRLGGINTLREVGTQTIRSLHFLDGAAATYRWGAGHSHGAIVIVTDG